MSSLEFISSEPITREPWSVDRSDDASVATAVLRHLSVISLDSDSAEQSVEILRHKFDALIGANSDAKFGVKPYIRLPISSGTALMNMLFTMPHTRKGLQTEAEMFGKHSFKPAGWSFEDINRLKTADKDYSVIDAMARVAILSKDKYEPLLHLMPETDYSLLPEVQNAFNTTHPEMNQATMNLTDIAFLSLMETVKGNRLPLRRRLSSMDLIDMGKREYGNKEVIVNVSGYNSKFNVSWHFLPSTYPDKRSGLGVSVGLNEDLPD